MLVVGRFIGGLGIGMLSMVAPLYISEVSPQEIRGASHSPSRRCSLDHDRIAVHATHP